MDFENVSDELKARALGCKTADELAALAAEEGVELTDEELDAISGGSWACSDYVCTNYSPCKRRKYH